MSTGLYDSLNVGRGSRDQPAAVLENRRRAATVFGRDVSNLNTCYQVHSAQAVVADAAFGAGSPRADGVVTARAGLICGAAYVFCLSLIALMRVNAADTKPKVTPSPSAKTSW